MLFVVVCACLLIVVVVVLLIAACRVLFNKRCLMLRGGWLVAVRVARC